MHQTRTVGAIALVALLTVGAVFATVPAQAEEDTTYQVYIRVDETTPSVRGAVGIMDAAGTPLPGGYVTLVSSHDSLPLPDAHGDGYTGGDGEYNFAFPVVSTANAPGSHTIDATLTYDGQTFELSTQYVVIA